MARQHLVARAKKRCKGLTRPDKRGAPVPRPGETGLHLGYATSAHPHAVLAGQAIKMTVAARGGQVAGVIFHTDRGSTYTADDFTGLCEKLKIT